MSAIWKEKEKNILAIDLGVRDIYGLDPTTFKFGYFNSEGVYTKIDSDNISEAIKTVEENSCLADGDTPKGNTDIKVKDKDDDNKVSNFNKGDVIKVKDKEIYFYVSKVDTDNNIISSRRPISEDIEDGDELQRVGNTGLYGATFSLDTEGIYFGIINNPSIDLMNRSIKIKVEKYTEKNTYQKLQDLEIKINDIDNKVDSIGGVDGVVLA